MAARVHKIKALLHIAECAFASALHIVLGKTHGGLVMLEISPVAVILIQDIYIYKTALIHSPGKKLVGDGHKSQGIALGSEVVLFIPVQENGVHASVLTVLLNR